MKPKWVEKKEKEKTKLVEFYLPIGQYRLVMNAKGKRSWREFVIDSAKHQDDGPGLEKKKDRKPMGEKVA